MCQRRVFWPKAPDHPKAPRALGVQGPIALQTPSVMQNIKRQKHCIFDRHPPTQKYKMFSASFWTSPSEHVSIMSSLAIFGSKPLLPFALFGDTVATLLTKPLSRPVLKKVGVGGNDIILTSSQHASRPSMSSLSSLSDNNGETS